MASTAGKESSPWAASDGWRLGGRAQRDLCLRAAEVEVAIAASYRPSGWALSLDGSESLVSARWAEAGMLQLTIDALRLVLPVIRSGSRLHVFSDGDCQVLTQEDPMHMGAAAAAGTSGLSSPMPGRVIELLAAAGAQVAKGTALLVLEAMKIEHTIVAPEAGIVRGFKVAAGEQVGEGVELVDFAPDTAG